ncbi:hypothetical protein DFH09DRAFT_1078087 [Mycena vulgaris]|nr:hypothetical protein DFH09DRAFT_1078087 [Mycena vulgaris]
MPSPTCTPLAPKLILYYRPSRCGHRLAQVMAEHHRHVASLSPFNFELMELQHTVRDCRALNALSPINRLAPEILDEIVSSSLAFYDDDWQASATARGDLALVCCHWNTRLYGQSLLWTDIQLRSYTNPAFVVLCLKNSMSCPLIVTIDCKNHPVVLPRLRGSSAHRIINCSGPTLIALVLPRLFADVHRISKLTVTCDDTLDFKPIFEDLLKYPAPSLRCVRFNLPIRQPDQRHLISPFEGFALTHAGFWSIHPPWLVTPNVFSQLCVLKLAFLTGVEHITWSELAGVFSSASHTLTTLQLTEVVCAEVDSSKRVTLPSLTHLLLGYVADVSVDVVVLLDTPVLRALCLTVHTVSVWAFTSRCQHILSHVQEFDLSVDRDSAETLPRLFQAAPNMIRLNLSRCSFDIVPIFVGFTHFQRPEDLLHLRRLLFSTVLTMEQVTTILQVAASGCRLVGRKDGDLVPLVEWVGPWNSPTEELYLANLDPHCDWLFWHADF